MAGSEMITALFLFSCLSPDTSFEVAAVRENLSGSRDMTLIPTPGGMMLANNVPLRLLVRVAFGVTDAQVRGGPEWTSSSRFDVKARATPGMTLADMRPMIQTLLADEFALRTHVEKISMPVLVLDLEAGGTKLKPSQSGSGTTRTVGRSIEGSAISLDTFARALSSCLGYVLVNETGLAGNYDLSIKWSPEGADDPDAIYSALKGELGMRLRSQKRSVDVIVIYYAEKPKGDR
jgi:uncharacterized protein (TIGR03435 family)